jgi:hexosaminidase
MVTLFPDQYVHIGGDETPAPDWKKNPRILAFMKVHRLENNAALQAYFNRRVLAILTHLHRRMEGWDEIFNPALPKNVVIQSWRGVASLGKAAEQGYEGVLSAPYYLDGMQPASKHYLADPVPADTTLSPEQQKLILGGEICMWAEHLNERTIDSRIWPRSAAIAERFWSPQSVRDIDSMYRRLEPISLELESLGLKHLSSEGVGLRSLAGTEQIGPLQTFASAFEPVSFGERSSTQHTNQLTPLTSFVDAVRPDPPIRYQVEHAAMVLAKLPQGHSPEVDEARALLQRFFSNAGTSVPEVETMMESSPRLAEMRGRAEQLSQLATIGNQALKYLQDGSAPGEWKRTSLETIAAAKKPGALVRFHFLDPLSTLVNATQ